MRGLAQAPLRREASVAVRPAGLGKGQGAFAAEPIAAGAWVCEYVGQPVTLLETTQRYQGVDPEYLFQLNPDLYLDAMDSKHFSRFFNHDQKGNLNFTVSARSGMLECLAEPQCARRGSLGVLYRLLAAHSERAVGPLRAQWERFRA